MNIKCKKVRPDSILPVRASDGAVGYDVYASRVLNKLTKEVEQELPFTLGPGQSVLIGSGIQMEIPWPFQCEVRPRSGLANKFDVELSNSPGTIDPDFRGEAGILLRNRGKKDFIIEPNMRIAQFVFSRVEIPVLEETVQLSNTTRQERGFGGTGFFGLGLGVNNYERLQTERDRYYMRIVLAVAGGSNCVRGVQKTDGRYLRDDHNRLVGQTRKLGCVIVKEDNILAHGFNAQRPGPLCEETGCLRDELNITSGTQIEKCRAQHAEMWALSNLARSGNSSGTIGATLYVNAEPCEMCATVLSGLGLADVVVLKGVYPNNGLNILRASGINIRYIEV